LHSRRIILNKAVTLERRKERKEEKEKGRERRREGKKGGREREGRKEFLNQQD
jgi:hypothetical protein